MSEAIAEPALDGAGADESACIVRSRPEIVHILRALVRSRALATVHVTGTRGTLVTPLIAVEDADGEIIVDCSADPALNRSILDAASLLFVSSQDKVRIRFSSAPARLVDRDDGDALAVPIPAELLRLQRREFYRVQTPVARAVLCTLPVGSGSGLRFVQTRVYDIGLGGVAVIAPPGTIPAEPGTRYENCRIALPDAGNVVVGLEVRSRFDMQLANGKAAVRIGCRFVRPSPATSSLIQRYTMRMERERKRRE